jgi:hypothetical protein
VWLFGLVGGHSTLPKVVHMPLLPLGEPSINTVKLYRSDNLLPHFQAVRADGSDKPIEVRVSHGTTENYNYSFWYCC